MVRTASALNAIIRQDKTQAAENYSPPPVSAPRLRAETLEVAYTMTVQDWISAYRIGTSHLRLGAVKVAALGLSVVLLGVAVMVFYDGYAYAWHRQHIFPWHYVHTILLASCIGPAVFALLMPLLLWSAAARKITLQDLGIVIRLKSGRSVVFWKRVSGIFNDAEHIAICSSNFDALIIPRRAFPDEQAAESFYTAVLNYWHEAKGTKPPFVPDIAGVWPPAPRSTNSAEPGDTR